MKSALSIFAATALLSFAVAACNDNSVVGSPVEPTPSPTDTPANPEAPVAIIDGASPLYSTDETAAFDGSFSYDPDGYIVSYAWEIVSKPASSAATIIPDTFDGSTSTMAIDIAGDYTIKLTVTDDSNLTDSTTVTFSAAPSDLHVQLAWPGQYTHADMDLHVIETTGTTPAPQLWDMAYDCHWRNCKLSEGEVLNWGDSATDADNPRQDVDNINITVPENTVIQTPSNGTYHVAVHYYGNDSSGSYPVDATVSIWLHQALVYSSSQTISNINDVWEVGDIVWSSGGGVIVAEPAGTIDQTAQPGFGFNSSMAIKHPHHYPN